MSYDPSHRMPPRQERWPAATPAEGRPSYQTGTQPAMATAAYPAVTNGYGGYAGTADYFAGGDDYRRDDYRRDDYARSSVGYAEPQDGYDWGYAGDAYLGPGSYVEPGDALTDDPVLTTPDAGVYPERWRAEQARRRGGGGRGAVGGAGTQIPATR